MCRSIKTLRPPYTEDVTSDDVRAAALQYVRKIAGMRAPAAANQEVFDEAVEEIAAATAHLLAHLKLRAPRTGGSAEKQGAGAASGR
jgi:hypothetical protein